jgi:ergothioneine biosynthesis protein EgtB
VLTAQSSVANDLKARMSDARQRSDELFRLVRPDFLYQRPIAERHRIIFYVGHLEAFDWNLLQDGLVGRKSPHPELDRLFAFGIDPVGGGLPNDQPSDWPSRQAVHDYVTRTRAALDSSSANLDPGGDGRDGFSLATLLNVAIEHRLMHVETLAYMLHQMPLPSKVPHADPPPVAISPVIHRLLEIPGGTTTLGLSGEGDEFGWDNEYESHTTLVPAFEIDRYPVTHRQYLEFIAAGGYDTHLFWSSEDWEWKNAKGVSHPAFWKKAGGDWLYRTMFEDIPLPLDWPVYVSHAEAAAYSRWAGKSLPSEPEWHRAAYGTPRGDQRRYPWGGDIPRASFGNFDLRRWNPTAVNASPLGQSAFGVEGMLGNGWEWTSTVFAPFPGFQPFPFYRGYSADFFDGKHFVMKGGSARTAGSMLRPTFRNWFQAHYPYVYAGFRCVVH